MDFKSMPPEKRILSPPQIEPIVDFKPTRHRIEIHRLLGLHAPIQMHAA